MSSNIWSPAPKSIDNSYILEFIILLNNKYNINIKNYDELHAWSIDNINSFWSELLAFSHIAYEGKYREAVDDEYKMPGARWFKGLSINYAENLLRKNNKDIAIEFHSENGSKTETSYFELNKQASSVSNYLVKLGVKPGDRVAAVVSNIPESVIFMLGCASVGAVWTSCSPDFGEQAIIDRFEQVNTKILVLVYGYKYVS